MTKNNRRYTLGPEVTRHTTRGLYLMRDGDYLIRCAYVTASVIDNISDKCEISSGYFFNGIFKAGIFAHSAFYGGIIHDGDFYDSRIYGGEFHGGEFNYTRVYAGEYGSVLINDSSCFSRAYANEGDRPYETGGTELYDGDNQPGTLLTHQVSDILEHRNEM